MQSDTPVVVIGFNRPQTTARILRRLSGVRPRLIYAICDGARSHVPGESAAVCEVRRLFDRLPWSCTVERDFSSINLGCRERIVSGLWKVFDRSEKAIILEDDCLPSPTFFPFCEELLARYEHDNRVGSICGMTHDVLSPPINSSYRFSRYCFVWGWATWRRAWQRYDVAMEPVADGSLDVILRRVFSNPRARLYWKIILKRCYEERINTWDYQWALSCWKHNMIHVTPSVSLVENIGIGADSTHTRKTLTEVPNILSMNFPLTHPQEVETSASKDDSIEDRVFSRNFRNRVKWIYRKYLS